MKNNVLKPMVPVLFILLLAACSSTPKRLDVNKDLVADSGELTAVELEKSAVKVAKSISDYYAKNPQKDGLFVALLPTKNNTSEQIQVDVFDNTLVNELRKKNVFTVRTATRTQALSEIEFSMSGLAEKPLSLGKMKSPNFFIKTDINESMYKSSGDRIVEQVINTELIEVTTQIMAWSDRLVYRKKAVSGRGAGW